MNDAEYVTASDIDDDVSPGQGEGDESEEDEEDEDDDVVGLMLRPEEDGVDIVAPQVHGAHQEAGK